MKKGIIKIFVLCLVFTSCQRSLGYGVLLWSMPEKSLNDGTLLKIHIKSNITKMYVASIPGQGGKFEVPLWQLSEPASRNKTLKNYEPFRQFERIYANVLLDGLPIRFEASNTSRQIYRLRKGEIVKILEKGAEEQLTSGVNKFDGNWYRVMTKDGTRGWCFSYNLAIFDETVEVLTEVTETESTNEIDEILSKRWYPESYRTMIEKNMINLQELQNYSYFDPKTEDGNIELSTNEYNISHRFHGTEKSADGVYKLTGTPIRILIRAKDEISVQFTSPEGEPVSLGFVSLKESIRDIIAGERQRRAETYMKFLTNSGTFFSESHGTIQFLSGQNFVWEGYYVLTPDIIPDNAAGKGDVSFGYFTSDLLSNSYDGVISFNFEETSEPINFLYRFEQNELVMETTLGAEVRGNLVVERSANPVICRFTN